ncbi:MAG: hypothetical protein AB7O97_24420 [Planctomycetota bacterium]
MAVTDVVIYVQGIHRFVEGLTIDRLADGLAAALGPAHRPTGTVEEARFEGSAIAIRTIECGADGAFAPAVALVEADYYDVFMALEEAWLPQRARETAAAVFANLPLAARPFAGAAGAKASRLQRLYVLILVATTLLTPLLLVLLVGYASWQIGGAVADAARPYMDAAPAGPGAPAAAAPAALAGLAGMAAALASAIVLIKALWEHLLPKVPKAFLRMFARDPVRMLQYFTGTPARRPVRGRILARLDRAWRFARRRHPDARIHLVAYSFGAVMAYDWLFPLAGARPAAAAPRIASFVTLGLPHDMVATFWPDYFGRGRDFAAASVGALHTLNLHDDVVGSALPADAAVRSEIAAVAEHNDETIPPAWLAELRVPQLGGIQAHGLYFGFADRLDSPAFRRIAAALSGRGR